MTRLVFDISKSGELKPGKLEFDEGQSFRPRPEKVINPAPDITLLRDQHRKMLRLLKKAAADGYGRPVPNPLKMDALVLITEIEGK